MRLYRWNRLEGEFGFLTEIMTEGHFEQCQKEFPSILHRIRVEGVRMRMKYVVVLCDGMADEPLEELGGMTPLEKAHTPNLDRMAQISEIGMVQTVPDGMAPGSDTANLSVIGYDPKEYYTGRSPLEALSIGVDMAPTDVSFRCNLVTLSEEEENYEDKHILDHSSSEISTEDAAVLMETLMQEMRRGGYEFYTGTSYRHLLIHKIRKCSRIDSAS